jgi:hypothetical protein
VPAGSGVQLFVSKIRYHCGKNNESAEVVMLALCDLRGLRFPLEDNPLETANQPYYSNEPLPTTVTPTAAAADAAADAATEGEFVGGKAAGTVPAAAKGGKGGKGEQEEDDAIVDRQADLSRLPPAPLLLPPPLTMDAVQPLVDTIIGLLKVQQPTEPQAGQVSPGVNEQVLERVSSLVLDESVHSQTLAHASYACLPLFKAYTSSLLSWLGVLLVGTSAAAAAGAASAAAQDQRTLANVGSQRDLLVGRLKALVYCSNATASVLRRTCIDLLARERAVSAASDRVAILGEILHDAGCLDPACSPFFQSGRPSLKRKGGEHAVTEECSSEDRDQDSSEDVDDDDSSCF